VERVRPIDATRRERDRKGDVKFRFGLVVGFGLGYYLGARAGRARYEQMRRRLERLRDSRLFDRLQAAVELSVERMRPEEQSDIPLHLVDQAAR
jgi:hypothetical protein